MPQFFLHQLPLLSCMGLFMLVSCTHQSDATLPTPTQSAQSSQPTPLKTQPSAAPVEAQSTDGSTLANAATGNLLTPEQIAKLTQLPIPIVAPTDLPPGFRVVSADGGSDKYTNGDDDAGYVIEYEGAGNVCFVIQSSKDGPRRLKQVGQVETAVGLVKMYEETYEDKRSVQSFIPVKGNPVMISPVARFNPAKGDYEACNPLDLTQYERILKSIELVK